MRFMNSRLKEQSRADSVKAWGAHRKEQVPRPVREDGGPLHHDAHIDDVEIVASDPGQCQVRAAVDDLAAGSVGGNCAQRGARYPGIFR